MEREPATRLHRVHGKRRRRSILAGLALGLVILASCGPSNGRDEAGRDGSLAREDYVTNATAIVDRLERAVLGIIDLFDAPAFTSERWQSDLLGGLVGMRRAHADAQLLFAPRGLERAHQRVLEASGTLDEAAEGFARIPMLDFGNFEATGELLEDGVRLLEAARAELVLAQRDAGGG